MDYANPFSRSKYYTIAYIGEGIRTGNPLMDTGKVLPYTPIHSLANSKKGSRDLHSLSLAGNITSKRTPFPIP